MYFLKRDSARYLRALELRRAGLTLRKVGAELGVSPERARQMIWMAEHIEKQHQKIAKMGDDPELWAVLSGRVMAVLETNRIATRRMRLSDLRKMEIPERWLGEMYGYGKKTHKELREWASGEREWRGLPLGQEPLSR